MSEFELPKYEYPLTIYTTVVKPLGYVVRYTVPTVVRTSEGVRHTYQVVTEVTYYLGEKGVEVTPAVITKFRRAELRVTT
jgi:hypothetical protein